MNNLDYAILMVAAVFALLGLYWGLIRQVLSIVGLVVGVMVAGRYGPEVGAWLSSFLADPLLAGAIGFLGVLLLVSAAVSLIASLLRIFVGLLFLGWLDHTLGAMLGLVQAALAASVVLVVMAAFPLTVWSAALEQSALAGPLLRIGSGFSGVLPELFRAAVRAATGG